MTPDLAAVVASRGQDAVVVARRASVPLVQLRALLPGPGGAAARVAAACLLRRKGAREALDDLGATAEVMARADGIVLSACAEPAAAEALLALAQELLAAGGGLPQEIMDAERVRLAQLDTAEAHDPGARTRRAALSAAFGPDSPYAEEHDRVGEVTAAAVQHWHDGAGPGAVLVLCGDIDPTAAWGDPTELGPAAAEPLRGLPVGPRWRVADRPGSAQTTLRGVAPFPRPGSRHRAAAAVAERLLGGGGKGSRLVRELRDRRGFGYHPGTAVLDLAGTSYLLLEADVATQVTAEAVSVVDEVLASFGQDPPAQAELDAGRRGVVGDLARAMDGQGSLADLLLALSLDGVGPDGVAGLAAAIQAVPAAEVVEAATTIATGLHGAAAADLAALRDQPLPPTWG